MNEKNKKLESALMKVVFNNNRKSFIYLSRENYIRFVKMLNDELGYMDYDDKTYRGIYIKNRFYCKHPVIDVSENRCNHCNYNLSIFKYKENYIYTRYDYYFPFNEHSKPFTITPS